MNVSIYSRKAIEKLIRKGFPSDVAVISFYDPMSEYKSKDYKPVDYSEVCNRVFYICVYDIDIEILGEYNLTYDTYLPEVNSLAEFIKCAKNDNVDIICQCEYGQSRSSACAAAILEYFYHTGIKVFADYRYYPNQLIFNKIFNALCVN